jgi:hypothetical protein
VAAVRCPVRSETLLVASGFVSEAAVTAVELATPGLTILAALQREPHGRPVAQLEKRSNPPAPLPEEAPFAEGMRHRTATTAGRVLSKLRSQAVEPVFGIIQDVRGFRRCCLRALANDTLEGESVSLADNGKRLHRLGAAHRAA